MMPLAIKFKILHLITHLLSLVGVLHIFNSAEIFWIFVAIAGYLFCGIIGVNVSLHRYFSHQSFKTSQIGYWFLLISSLFPLLGSPATWGAYHRLHHLNSDKQNDPHNPKEIGYFRAWFASWYENNIPLSLFRSFAKDKNVMFLDKYYFSIVILLAIIIGSISWKVLVFAWIIPAVGCFHGAAAIAVLPHINCPGSYRSYDSDDESRNCFWASLLSLGEGWHNNHHAQPNKYRQGERWWELDPSAFLIEHLFMSSRK